MNNISIFLEQLEIYQSNHYGMYDKNQLINTYDKLPLKIQQYLYPSTVKGLYRGCDGLSNKDAISFTNNKGYANTFGTYTIPFTELLAYRAAISTEKCLKLNNKLKLNFEIGDDEGEVIVILPVWKDTLDIEKYRN